MSNLSVDLGTAVWPNEESIEQTKSIDSISFTDALEDELNLIRRTLIEKNRKYGNSALNPCRIFSRSGPLEQLNVRIDDKLSRIQNQQSDDDEDAEFDLVGYLIIKAIAKRLGE